MKDGPSFVFSLFYSVPVLTIQNCTSYFGQWAAWYFVLILKSQNLSEGEVKFCSGTGTGTGTLPGTCYNLSPFGGTVPSMVSSVGERDPLTPNWPPKKKDLEILCTSIEDLDGPPILDGLTITENNSCIGVAFNSVFLPGVQKRGGGGGGGCGRPQRSRRGAEERAAQEKTGAPDAVPAQAKGKPKNESFGTSVVRPDPAFYRSADPDSDSGSQTNGPRYCSDFAWNPNFGHFLKFEATSTANNLFI